MTGVHIFLLLLLLFLVAKGTYSHRHTISVINRTKGICPKQRKAIGTELSRQVTDLREENEALASDVFDRRYESHEITTGQSQKLRELRTKPEVVEFDFPEARVELVIFPANLSRKLIELNAGTDVLKSSVADLESELESPKLDVEKLNEPQEEPEVNRTRPEWKDAIAKVCLDLSKDLNQQMFEENFKQMFSNDSEEIWPQVPLMRERDIQGEQTLLLKRFPIGRQNITFIELLHNSPDVALARLTNEVLFEDGRQINAKGVELFIPDGNAVKMKLSIFNFDQPLPPFEANISSYSFTTSE